jgi:hypothetical protein
MAPIIHLVASRTPRRLLLWFLTVLCQVVRQSLWHLRSVKLKSRMACEPDLLLLSGCNL